MKNEQEEDIFGKPIRRARINSKQKGNTNEREAAKAMQAWTGEEFARIPQSGGLQWANSMNVAADIMCTNPNYYFPFVVETKHLVTINGKKILKIWEQVMRDATKSGKLPFALIKRNRMGSFKLLENPLKKYSDYYLVLDERYGGTLLNLKVENLSTLQSEIKDYQLIVFRFSDVVKTVKADKLFTVINKLNLIETFIENGKNKTNAGSATEDSSDN